MSKERLVIWGLVVVNVLLFGGLLYQSSVIRQQRALLQRFVHQELGLMQEMNYFLSEYQKLAESCAPKN